MDLFKAELSKEIDQLRERLKRIKMLSQSGVFSEEAYGELNKAYDKIINIGDSFLTFEHSVKLKTVKELNNEFELIILRNLC